MEFSLGGTESMLLDIMQKQHESGHKLWLYIFHDHYSNRMIDQAKQYSKVSFLHSKKFSLFYDILKLNCMIKKIQPDIIHIHNPAFVRILFFHKDKIFATIHDINQNHSSFYRKLCKIQKIFAISDAVRNDLEKRYLYKNIVTVPNGIRLDKIARRCSYSNGSPTFRMVQVSRLEHKKKGQDVLIKAISIIIHNPLLKHTVHVDFIGEGNSEAYLEELTSRLECGENISFLGKKSREHIYNTLKEYDIIVQPSRYEGFGLTIVEGMAAGLIPLVSDSGGPKDIVGTDGKSGFLFQTGNPEDCARVLLQIMDLPSEEKNRIQRQAINKSNSYSIENMVCQYEAFYRGCN